MTGIVLSTTAFGDPAGRPIIALHGGTRTSYQWARLAGEVLPRRRWLCPDFRGHGTSPAIPPWTIPEFAKDVVTTLDSFGLSQVDIIGHSLGARVAAEVASQSFPRVRSLLLLDPPLMTGVEFAHWRARHPVPRPGEFDTLDDAIDWVLNSQGGDGRIHELPRSARVAMIQDVAAKFERTDAGTTRLRSDPKVIEELIDDMSKRFPYSIGKFSGRVLLLIAGLFDAVTDSGERTLRSRLGERLMTVVIDDAGHDLLWDSFERTASEIVTFLTDRDAATQGS